MRCSKCDSDNPEGAKFCIDCAAPLANRCPKCGQENLPRAKFCADCATPLIGAAPKSKVQPESTPSRVSPEEAVANEADGERKTVTALFADIKGSTELMRDLDPEEARAIVDPVLQLMMAAVHRYGGYVAQSTGDGIFAMFGAPVAHEDHPQRALHAALAMQEELHRYADRLRNEGKIPVEAGVGVNTGEVVVRTIETGGHTEYTPVGHVTNLAARMQTAAPAGSIAASEVTQRLCEGYFEFRALGPTAIKGLDAPVEVYEVVRAGPLRSHFQLASRRGLTRFVGREAELAQMKRALDLAQGGKGQIVAVVAEAGTGKSRLFHEFKAMLPAECKLLEAYSVSHGKASAWLPVLELLHDYFAIEGADDPAARREKVQARLTALDPGLADTLPYLFALIGITDGPDPLAQMDPQVKQRRTFEAIKRIVLRDSLNQPLVVVFEDLHWIDDHTQALLDLLADSLANARILLLVNYRSEYRHNWGNKSYYTQLWLSSLDQEGTGAMLTALLGEAAELSPLKQMIVERTEGNPFFIEEMVQALFDEGALVRNGTVKVSRSRSQIRLPPTVQGILASRIDRLPREHKQVLQTLAVVGRESPLALIKSLTASAEQQTERILADLQSGEFLYEQPIAADMQYVFKHALTQEVAYNSILIERRKLLHERVGQAIESVFAGQLDDHLARLAHHYSRSDNVSKATEYLGRVGQQAIQRSAYADAINSLSAALGLLQRHPDGPERIQRELSLQLVLGLALIATKGFAAPEVERAYAHARELCERLGDPPQLFPALHGVWVVRLVRSELRTAYRLAEQLLRRAQSAHEPGLAMTAHSALGNTSFWMGKLLLAREHVEKAISLLGRERHWSLGLDGEVAFLSYAAITLWALGYPDQAIKRSNEAVALAQSLCHPHSEAFAGVFLGAIRLHRQEARAAQETAERVIAIATEHGFPQPLGYGTSLRGAAMAAQGRNEEAIAQMQQGLATTDAIGTQNGRSSVLNLLAKAYMETSRFDEGLGALNEALAFADNQGERVFEAETHRLKGELLLKRDPSNVAEARACFQRAVEVARKQSAKSLELPATIILAQLLARLGRRDEARAMLAPIYGWFTEGFDTADLKDAKALLDELSG